MNACLNARPGRRAVVVGAFVAVLVVLGGCALSRPAPVKHTFLLDPPALTPVARVHAGALRVGTINVAAPFRGRAFVYRSSATKFEADFYSEFLVAPGAMIGEATARALDRSGVFARVIPPGAPPDGNWVLDGFVTALYGDVRVPGKATAEFRISYFLTVNDGFSVAPVWSRDYARSVPVGDSTPENYARALSGALGEIVGDLARDLAAADLARR